MFDLVNSLHYVVIYFLITGLFVAFALGSRIVFKPFVKKWWEGHDNNDQIAFYLSAVGVFYGITLGLFAAGVYQNFSETEERAQKEAAAASALYRDVVSLPEPNAALITQNLKAYIKYVTDTTWALHKEGVVHSKSQYYINNIQKHLYSIEPKTEREKVLMAEAVKQFNHFVELRRLRLQMVNSGMPGIVWFVIISGGFLVLVMCSLFNIPSQRLHNIMNVIMAISIGSLLYLIYMLNNPFKGDLAIQPDALKDVYESIMTQNPATSIEK